MKTKRQYYWEQLSIFLILIANVFLTAEAMPPIQNTLSEGSTWSLTIDEKQEKLTLKKPKVRHSSQKTKLLASVTWGGLRGGTIYGSSDVNNSTQFVKLKLNRRHGSEITCQGYIARETANFMAGTCGNENNGSAWYAVRKGGNTQCDGQVSTKPLSAFQDRISGDYYTRPKSKPGSQTFQVGSKLFPDLPASNKDLYKWLDAHNSALLSITNAILNNNDQKRFGAVENKECNTDIFCEIAFKQHTLQCALYGC